MKKIPYPITQFFTTLGCIIKDTRTWLLCLALTSISVIPAAFPAITYANEITAEWLDAKATAIYNNSDMFNIYNFLDLPSFSEIVDVYMSCIWMFVPVFIAAAASAVVMSFCLMALVKKNENT